MEKKGVNKGQYLVEPSIALSDFVEKINKLSYHDFPIDEVMSLFRKNHLSVELLDPYIFFSDARYTRNLIHKTPDFELLLLCWKPGQHSPVHAHEGEKCFMRVELGSLQFVDYKEEPPTSSTLVKKTTTRIGKEGYIDGPAEIHSVTNTTGHDALSLHLYARPFEQCDIYDLNTNQKMKITLGYHSIHGKLVVI